MADLTNNKSIVTQCQTGGRSSIAASILQAKGLEVINMTGGFNQWTDAHLPVDSPNAVACKIG